MFKKMCVSVLFVVLFVFMFVPLGYSFVSSMLPGQQEEWEYVENHSLFEENVSGVEGKETLSNRPSNLVSMLDNDGNLMFILIAPKGTVHFDLAEIYFVNTEIGSVSFDIKGTRLTTADSWLIMFPSNEVIESMKTGKKIVMEVQYKKFVFSLNGSKESLRQVIENK